jgi:hypothetical protein
MNYDFCFLSFAFKPRRQRSIGICIYKPDAGHQVGINQAFSLKTLQTVNWHGHLESPPKKLSGIIRR